jgi:tripeptide aminopeptidase
MIQSERLLTRLLRYVQIDTTANENAGCYPSSPGQLLLGEMLVEELLSLGLDDATRSEFGIVTATLPPTMGQRAPTIALNAHLDTSPETSAAKVKPQVVRQYDGRDLVLIGDPTKVIRVADNPELHKLMGRTLITSDGTTLLGSDDKAGIAVIMELVSHLREEQEGISHGPVRIVFTCDEEIGHGVDHVDLQRLGAVACYTLDGRAADEIDVETFSADLAIVTVRGVNIHPSIGKGKMVNAVRVAADFVSRLPRETFAPEATEEREGFLHPYAIDGGVAQVTLRILLRDFETAKLADQADQLRKFALQSQVAFPGSEVNVQVIPQYRNMAEGLRREPRAVAIAQEAFRRLGREPELTIIRGGTDGSRFTELGLPTPNLSCGQHNPHSPLEWACLEEMQQAVEVLVELVRLWGAESGPLE